jgi:hypothetical protein
MTAASKATVPNAVRSESTAPSVSIPASEPRLQARLKPVLNRGAKMEEWHPKASEAPRSLPR